MTWMHQLRRALTAPANLIAGAGALALSALTWNPLPLILFGLGEPVLLYRAAVPRELSEARISIATLERHLAVLTIETPCGKWARQGLLPDYPATYARLRETRDHTGRIVAARRDAASVLARDVVARMDDMLHAYLVMVRERLLFHCALAGVFPPLPDAPRRATWTDRITRALVVSDAAPRVPWVEDTRFVSLEAATQALRHKIAGFERQIAQGPPHDEVLRPIAETLGKHLRDLERRGQHDLALAAQLEVFPEQFAIILSKLGTPHADVSDVVTDMKLLLEQTDDTVSLAEELRAS